MGSTVSETLLLFRQLKTKANSRTQAAEHSGNTNTDDTVTRI
jgi:hypothetical protein